MNERHVRKAIVSTHMRWLALGLALASVGVDGFEPRSFPAAGTHGTTFEVESAARYRLEVSSATGTQLRLVSRLTGPTAWVGQPGKVDGSQDSFLDAGTYRVDVRGHADAKGDTNLRLSRFEELHVQRAPLRPGVTATSLDDLQQRTYTVVLSEPGPLFVEAAGRALGGLALRNNAGWLLHAVEQTQTRTPKTGQPLRTATLAIALNAGHYQLSVFGGKPLSWAREGGGSPLYLRRGIEVLAPDHSGRHLTSPFGIDRYLVPAYASFARMELPAAATASLRAQPFDGRDIFADKGQRAAIEPRQRVPVARVGLSRHGVNRLDALAGSHFASLQVDDALRRFWRPLADASVSKVRYHLISVSMDAGRGYRLALANDERRLVLKRAGQYFVEAAPVADVRDSARVTALAFAGPKRESRHSLYQSETLELTLGSSLGSQFNLDSRVEFFVRVHDAGRYRFMGEGVSATYALKPYGARDKTLTRTFPSSSPDGQVLERGFYRLRLSAPRGGMHQLQIKGPDVGAVAAQRMRSTARFDLIDVPSKHEAVVSLAAAAAELNVAVRALPIDLRVPMSVVLEPGEVLELPVQVPPSSTVHLQHDGQAEDFELAYRQQVSNNSLTLAGGTRLLRLSSKDVVARRVSVAAFVKRAQRMPVAKPLPVLSMAAPVRLDLQRGVPSQLWMDVPAPGVYRIETAGLLATSAALNAANVLKLATGGNNGDGRNVRLMRWLNAGRWRLDVAALGRSAGKARLHLVGAQQTVQSELHSGAAVARAMRPGQTWPINVRIDETGRYSLRVMTLARSLPVEMRDASGWPVATPGKTVASPLQLSRGRYQLLVHAPRNPDNVVVELAPTSSVARFVGHGPHSIDVGQSVTHRWDMGSPDRWRFRVSAPGPLTVQVSNGMAGHLVSPDGHRMALAGGALDIHGVVGRYELFVEHARHSNRHDYRVRILSKSLLPGQQRTLKVPATINVAVPASGHVRLRSSGGSDVRAELRDGAGRLLAEGDDVGANWNFDVGTATTDRTLRLSIAPVGKATASTTVRSEAVVAGAGAELSRAQTRTQNLVRHVLPADAVTLLSMRSVPDLQFGSLAPAVERERLVLASTGIDRTLTLPRAAEVSRHTLTPNGASLRHGQVAIEPRHAARLTLAGDKAGSRVTLDLPAGVYALLGVHTVGAAVPSRWTVDTTASELLVMNPLGEKRRAGVVVDPLTDDLASAKASLNAGAQGRWRPAPRWQRLHEAGQPLGLGGSAGAASRVSARHLEIVHGRGLIELHDLQAIRLAHADSRHIDASALHRGAVLDKATTATLGSGSDRLFALRSNAPVAWFLTSGERSGAGVLPAGTRLLATASQAQSDLTLVPLGERARVQLLPQAPQRLSEGVSGGHWMAPGARQSFEFELSEARRVGLGVRGSNGPAAIHLLGHADAQLPRHMTTAAVERDLPPGKYIVIVSNTMSTPQSVKVALVGTKAPASLPLSVVRRYLSRYQP